MCAGMYLCGCVCRIHVVRLQANCMCLCSAHVGMCAYGIHSAWVWVCTGVSVCTWYGRTCVCADMVIQAQVWICGHVCVGVCSMSCGCAVWVVYAHVHGYVYTWACVWCVCVNTCVYRCAFVVCVHKLHVHMYMVCSHMSRQELACV